MTKMQLGKGDPLRDLAVVLSQFYHLLDNINFLFYFNKNDFLN